MGASFSHLASQLMVPGQRAGLSFPFSTYPVLLICCLGGLKNIVHAFGFGYGLCMFVGGAMTYSQAPRTAWSTTACGLYMAYGARLVPFVLRRWFQDAYNTSTAGKDTISKTSAVKLSANAAVVVFVSLTQLATTCALQPAAFAEKFSPGSWAGLAVAGAGLLLETIADEEKNYAKKAKPDEPVMTGTYKLVRHPNYLGEILFWAGIIGASEFALPASATTGQRFGGCFGALLMIWVMFGAAKRLSKTSWDRYKDNMAYRAYFEKTKSLIPAML